MSRHHRNGGAMHERNHSGCGYVFAQGTAKQILKLAVRVCSGAPQSRRWMRSAPVVVVTGAHAELSRRELDGLDVGECSIRDGGNGHGIVDPHRGERSLNAEPDTSPVILALCDQPYLTAEAISALDGDVLSSSILGKRRPNCPAESTTKPSSEIIIPAITLVMVASARITRIRGSSDASIALRS